MEAICDNGGNGVIGSSHVAELESNDITQALVDVVQSTFRCTEAGSQDTRSPAAP